MTLFGRALGPGTGQPWPRPASGLTRSWWAPTPQGVLLSVSAGNREGLIDQETLEAVEGYPLLRTDLNSWVQLSTDGEEMWVEKEFFTGITWRARECRLT